MKNWRRYEILLPLRFNNGKRVPKKLLALTVEELEERFGALSSETQVIHGRWRQAKRRYQDELMRIWVDCERDPEVTAFFTGFKKRLKVRFRQKEIWLITHTIQLL